MASVTIVSMFVYNDVCTEIIQPIIPDNRYLMSKTSIITAIIALHVDMSLLISVLLSMCLQVVSRI